MQKSKIIKFGAGSIVLTIGLFVSALTALVIWNPRAFVLYFARWFAPPKYSVQVDEVRWTSSRTLSFTQLQVGSIFRVGTASLSWNWTSLFHKHLRELKLQQLEILVNLKELDSLGSSPDSETKRKTTSRPWLLKHLIVERGGLLLVGIAPNMPPLNVDVEGSFEGIPFGSNISKKDAARPRVLELRQLQIHSPIDPTMILVGVDTIRLEFNWNEFREHRLNSLVFENPKINIDRSLFEMAAELRKNSANRKPSSASSKPWIIGQLKIAGGKLNIPRLQLEYPFEFEAERQNCLLKDLSLADFKIGLIIRNQDIHLNKADVVFKNLRGKLAFNQGKSEPTVVGSNNNPDFRPSNNMVNVVYVDEISWKGIPVDNPWLSLTFDPHTITGSYGGKVAKGYVNGGVSFGWSGTDPWRFWGSANKVDTAEIFGTLTREHFDMNGFAELSFDLHGKEKDLDAQLSLRSLTKGTMYLRALNDVIERLNHEYPNIKREILKTLVENFREYPYTRYDLKTEYHRPNAQMEFKAEGARGLRHIKLNWHGLKQELEEDE